MKYIKIHKFDNVAVALEDLTKGTKLTSDNFDVTLKSDIPAGHKFAIIDIEEHSNVLKYGNPIGYALSDILRGEHVHTHNVKTLLKGTKDYTYQPNFNEVHQKQETPTFQGYLRSDGTAGIRNELWIIPTVGCVNKIAVALKKQYEKELPNGVDSISVFEHPYGCSQLGEDHINTQKILANLVKHPNAGGVLVLGLGCENNTMDSFKEIIGEVDSNRVKFLVAQDVDDELEAGYKLLKQLGDYASSFTRESIPVSKLKIGLKCGGSDGLSGITANPLVGVFSDKLIECGGTSILTEVPEMFGAEELLMNRCESRDVFDKCVNMVNSFKEYFLRYNQVVYENPSPGNKDGGITTLEDKSLGCTQKGGDSKVVDVIEYGESVIKPGLNLLSGPGNDIVAATVLAAAGAHIVLFTTGRGTPFGGPVPTLKISSNSKLAEKKKNWIDFDAGVLVDNPNFDKVGNEFFDYIISVASGTTKAKNEVMDYREIAIFKDGVTL